MKHKNRPYDKEVYDFVRNIQSSGKFTKANGFVDWAKVAAAHPEWVTRLNYASSTNFQKAYQIASKLRKEDNQRRGKIAQAVDNHLPKQRRKRRTFKDTVKEIVKEAEQTAVDHSKAIGRVLDGCRFCPRCGFDQSVLHRAILMGLKLNT